MSGATAHAATAADLLFLAPCVPAQSGSPAQVRWYHMLRYLSGQHRVHFGGMAGPGSSAAQIARIKALCYETCFVAPPSFRDRLHGADPGRELSAWAGRIARRVELQAALACSASMAMHLAGMPRGPVLAADYLDLESHELGRHASTQAWPLSHLTWRLADRQAACEDRAAKHLDRILLASSAAARLLAERLPAHAQRTQLVPNGVDADYFSPHILHRCPYPPGVRALLFAGALDEPANAEAAEWFARKVFAPLRAQGLALQFHVAGPRPSRRVLALCVQPGVVVTSDVADLRPWLAHATLVVAPLVRPSGMYTTVLEAMAMQQVVLASPAALRNVPAQPGTEVLHAGEPAEWLQAIRTALATAGLRHIGKVARERVLREARWETGFAALGQALSHAASQHAASQHAASQHASGA